MEMPAPGPSGYGNAFRCIGGACEDTCCHGMTVPVDKTTYVKLQRLPAGQMLELAKEHIRVNLASGTENLYATLGTTATGDCVFLAPDRLCGIQKEHGAGLLSATCSIYPRVLNRVNGRLEASLYLSCPEAARRVLLEPRFLQSTEPIAANPYRTDQFSVLAENGPRSLYKPYGYFAEVRSVVVSLIRDCSRPMWQRLFLVGMLCKQLDTTTSAMQDVTVPGIVNAFRMIVEAGSMRQELDEVPLQTPVHMDLALRLGDLCIRGGFTGERFQECFRLFTQGIGYSPQSTPASDLQHYQKAEVDFCRPLLEAHPWLMENYLLNYVRRTLFPFGRAASAHFEPQGILGEFLLMATQYAMLNGLMTGMAGSLQESFNTEHVVKLVQSFSKSVEHSPRYLRQLREFITERNFADDQGIAALVRA